ncbi:MAG: PLP-dependent aminotransferase family protein [Terasakiella sp.]|uniref:MocR-like pyridoxine biosynthesis transcription factor PdxR n=1 Tax=unclassified Terasakiella TaxID=2614952 RepID=UPI003AFFED1E
MSDLQLSYLKDMWLKNTEAPKYRALYVVLRDLILSGKLSGGEKLPPSRKIVKELSISRNTVMQAFDILQSDGFIQSRQGDGVYVSEDIGHAHLPQILNSDDVDERTPDIAGRVQHWLGVRKQHHRFGGERAFSPGRPALDQFPFDVWARLLSRRWRLSGPKLAMADDPAGYAPLRQELATYLRKTRGMKCEADQIIIVSGAQQGLDLISRVLWEEGDQIAVEDPAFPGISGVVLGSGAQIIPVELDEEGICTGPLEALEDLKSILVTPSRNYPLGTTMSLARRFDLLDVARRKCAWIVEDDFDCEFRFDGPPLSSLQGLDRDGRVIYVSTFSRIVFPALRLGYVVVPRKLVDAFVAAKSYIDGHASILHQAVLADFFHDGYFDSHLRRMKKLYKKRRHYLIKEIELRLGKNCFVIPADGGLHICLLFKKEIDDIVLSDDLRQCGVVTRPLSSFYKKDVKKQGLVLGFAGFDEAAIDAGLQHIQKKISEI